MLTLCFFSVKLGKSSNDDLKCQRNIKNVYYFLDKDVKKALKPKHAIRSRKYVNKCQVCLLQSIQVFFRSIQNQLRLLVASEDGYLYVYNLDGGEGGDLTLLKQHRLDGRAEDAMKAGTHSDAPTGRTEPQPIGQHDTGNRKK